MRLNETVNGKTALFGLIGCPVEHTKSPYIHNTLFDEFNINAIYVPVHVGQGDLQKAVEGMRAQNFSGFNITVPYKKEIIKYLDDVSNDALLMGAVNTVKNIDGRLKGYNTDAEGFSRDFKDSFETGFEGKRIVLLGAGGTARALAIKLAAEGAEKLTIVNRTLENAKNIVELVRNNYGNVIDGITPDAPGFARSFEESHIIINTTPAGMSTYETKTPFDRNFTFQNQQLVYDVIYTPVKTRFLEQAEECGCKIRNGFGMLINQGISAFEIWTGKAVARSQATKILNLIVEIEDLEKK
ncbi:shikimate dehydrogenase [Ruminiclostridium hungatei]|uniref:Shikimate dehydrogenase (NADP(+)) n=1 Tax=Ruminiclostridium hungatei TaxID=48256 RepID=A0A1V4SH36_RUMHU|nr:shikimate dehydrogenase [Ruminiclostridium hungatei]OPX43180.1 shikimate dehydrogenase [Ruminiclostridium hungatei]